MKKFLRRRPSASMLVAMTALVVASSGTAIAASLVNGDKLIKKHSLSGNRLRNHTITGTQVNVNKLGKVPSAKNADHATSATTATAAVTAGAATVATNATNAAALGGAAPSAYEPSAHFFRTGLVTATSGQTVPLVTFGVFTLKLNCVAGTTAGTVQAEIDATSNVANSDGYGTAMTTPGTPYKVLQTFNGFTSTFTENDDNAADFFPPTGQTYLADLTVGQNFPGTTTAGCFANAFVSTS